MNLTEKGEKKWHGDEDYNLRIKIRQLAQIYIQYIQEWMEFFRFEANHTLKLK